MAHTAPAAQTGAPTHAAAQTQALARSNGGTESGLRTGAHSVVRRHGSAGDLGKRARQILFQNRPNRPQNSGKHPDTGRREGRESIRAHIAGNHGCGAGGGNRLGGLNSGTLAHAGAGVEQITALAVTTGPGSFTGVRIGISAVKGLGLGLAQPPQVVGIPTLSVTAAPWLDAAATGTSPATICAYVQAGRGRYNWAFFHPGDLLRRPGREDHAAGAAAELWPALAALAPQPVWLAGEAGAELEEEAASLNHVCLVDGVSALRRAGHLARLAALHLAAGRADDLASLQPLYLQNP